MKVIRRGSKGAVVRQWQNFLLGNGLYNGEVDGDFGPKTVSATKAFQQKHKLMPVDGIVGNDTWGKAMCLGLQAIPPVTTHKQSAGWPPAGKLAPTNLMLRRNLFGAFKYEAAPTANNREGIKILGNWQQENIVSVTVPQLSAVSGAPKSGRVFFHRAVAAQLVALFQAWEDAGLIDRVLTWGGSFNPRFIRGSTKHLSNHAWGTAFDINVRWNFLGVRPALAGSKGSVRELVPLAEKHGFYWGGYFKTRPDGPRR